MILYLLKLAVASQILTFIEVSLWIPGSVSNLQVSSLACFLSNNVVKFIEEMYASAPKLPRSGANGSAKQ